MLYYLSQWLMDKASETAWADHLSALRVFRYITVRSAGAAITALLLSLWLGPKVIRWLQRLKFGQDYDDKAQKAGTKDTEFFSKRGTPTMGGILIVTVVDLTALLWCQWNSLVTLTLVSLLVLGALGFYDDYKKITEKNADGAAAHVKLWVQTLLAIFIAVYLGSVPETNRLISDIMGTFLQIPGVGRCVCHRSPDYRRGHRGQQQRGQLHGRSGRSGDRLHDHRDHRVSRSDLHCGQRDLCRLSAGALRGRSRGTHRPLRRDLGAGLGFLWFNCHPAQVFMGDTGSLALGGVLGIMAVLIHQPFVIVIAGGVFVVEGLSVVIQRYWFKYTRIRFGEGRRVFLMAPIHHHFQKKG